MSRGKHRATKKKMQQMAAQTGDEPSFAQEPSPIKAGVTEAGASEPNAFGSRATESPRGADEAVVDAADSGSGEEGSYSAENAVLVSEDAASLDPAPELSNEKKEARRKKHLKVAGIVSGSVIGAVAVVYLVGVAVFSFLFMPNTVISGTDISFKSVDDVEQVLNQKIGDYSFSVIGQGIRLNMSAEEAGLGIDSDTISQEMLHSVNAWEWPLQIFQHHDMTESLVGSFGNTKLANLLRSAAAQVNETAEAPVDATIGYDDATDSFTIIPESYGKQIDPDKLIEYTSEAAVKLQNKILLPEDVLLTPAVHEDDPRLSQAVTEANQLIRAQASLLMGGDEVAVLDPDTVAPWVAFNPTDFSVALNDEAISAWAVDLADKTTTIGTERTYRRPDGKTITVSGGDYGWRIDTVELVNVVKEAIAAAQTGEIEVPLSSTAAVWAEQGNPDWGSRYIDIDLSEQYARLYSNGEVLWESAVVSGKPNPKNATPTGVYFIKSNGGSSVLRGTNNDGSKYESYVSYWMPFVGNYIGLHDADWQSSFGGTRYADGYGSHGCVNLPVSAAAALHNIIYVGDPVVCHY